MNVKPLAPVVPVVAIVPEDVQFDCPACDVTHMLSRRLDFAEDREGVWRMNERPGFECDCGALIHADFRIVLAQSGPEAP